MVVEVAEVAGGGGGWRWLSVAGVAESGSRWRWLVVAGGG